MKYASAFTGIGGFEVGFGEADMEPTALIEWDPNCQTVLQRHYPHVPLIGDIADARGADLGRPELVVGGFPCQDTSIAAPHRAGLAGRRSGQFFEFTRLVGEYQRIVDELGSPRWVVIENPAGLLRSNDGRDAATVFRSLEDLGYGWAYRLVDGRHLGTPQRRGRVLVVGHRGGDPRPAGRVLGLLEDGGEAAAPRQVRRGPSGSAPAGAAFAAVWRKSARARAALSAGGYETWVSDGHANTLTGFDGGGPARQTHLIAQHGRLRTLTFTEWERLQGFPDGWTDGVPPGDVRKNKILVRAGRYTVLGNAIHTGTAAWLGRRLMAVHAELPQLTPIGA